MVRRAIPALLCLGGTLLFLVAAPRLCGAGEVNAVVNASEGNVRSGPGTGYPVVTTIKEGTSVKVLEQSGAWCRIQMPRDGHGWIYKKLLTFSEEAAPAEKTGGFLDTIKRGFQASRRSEMTAAAGSRGLGEEDSTSMATDYQAVEKMDAYDISSQTVRKFIQDGELSPKNMP